MKKLLAVGIALVMANTAQAGLYRWVDHNEKVHFSDKIPAAVSKKPHIKLNKSGDVTGQINPAAQQKQLDLKAVIMRKKEQLAKISRNKAKAHDVIQQRDDNLLSIYENEGELVRFYMSKIKIVEGNSKILEAQNEVLNKKIVNLEVKASSTEHDPMLKNITKKIVNINKILEQYKQALDESDMDLLQLSTNYQTDLARYKVLTK